MISYSNISVRKTTEYGGNICEVVLSAIMKGEGLRVMLLIYSWWCEHTDQTLVMVSLCFQVRGQGSQQGVTRRRDKDSECVVL